MRAAGFRAEQDVERFRRGDDDVRRLAAHLRALAPRRVAGAHPGADIDIRQALARSSARMPASGTSRFLLDVVRQRLQRRDVDDLRLVEQAPRAPWRTSSSIAARKAASVLPEPVGAAISHVRPRWIAGHAARCAAVGPRSGRRTSSPPLDETELNACVEVLAATARMWGFALRWNPSREAARRDQVPLEEPRVRPHRLTLGDWGKGTCRSTCLSLRNTTTMPTRVR